MSLNKNQEYLIGLVADQERRAEDHYWRIFGMMNRSFQTAAKVLNFEDVVRNYVIAKAIPAGGNVPILQKDGIKLVAITPDEVGAGEPLEAESSIERIAGQSIYNGQVLDNKNYHLAEAAAKVGDAILAAKNRIATEIFFNGTYTNELGSVYSFGLNAIETVADSTIDNYNVWIADRVREIAAKGSGMVTVMAGSKIIEKLINEVNTAPGKNRKLDYRAVTGFDTNGYYYIESATIGLRVIQYPLAYDSNGDLVDTSSKIHIFSGKGLVQAYAGVKARINKQARMISTDMWVDVEEGTAQNPSELLFAKSAPMAGILNADWFERYEITFA